MMHCRYATFLALGILASPACPAGGPRSLWREPIETGLRMELPSESDGASPTWSERQLLPDVELTTPESSFLDTPSLEARLRLRAQSLGPVPTVVEQWGADIEYCPDYLPELYPERNLAQLCGNRLLRSPFLDQGADGHNFFRTARSEVDRMRDSDEKLARKLALAGAHYWFHRDSPNAVDGAFRTFLSGESPGLWNALTNALAPRALDLLPPEISGLPPPEDFGTAIDLRVTTRATWKSVADPDSVLLSAAERGLQGIVVADADHLVGYLEVRDAADRLKREGALPQRFMVLKGQEVTTLGGTLVALFIDDRVPRGMTMRAAVGDIHGQGGVAILTNPGAGSGAKLTRTLPVDGYFLRTRPASVYRTLELMGDMALADKPLLSASGARSAGTVGIPYSVVETPYASPESVRRGLREHRAFGAAAIQMPVLGVMASRPFVSVERGLVRWFEKRDDIERKLERMIGSDNVEIRTSYDAEIEDLIGIFDAADVVTDIFDGASPLTRTPDIRRISADYSYVRVEWDREDRTVMVKGAIRW